MAYDTTKGIQINGIPKMQSAIRSYKSKIQKQVNNALTYGDYSKFVNQAIKGTNSQAAFKKMLEEIKTKESALVSQLDKWDKYLDTLSSSYKTQEQKFTF